jgi:hypothetical protein
MLKTSRGSDVSLEELLAFERLASNIREAGREIAVPKFFERFAIGHSTST